MWLPSAVDARALDTLALLEPGPSLALLQNKKPIYAESGGQVPVSYGRVLTVLQQPDLMNNVQQAYSELIVEGEAPEFSIRQTSSNTYFYINRKGERTDVTELVRKQTSEENFEIVLYSAGERFFGRYEALIHVRIEAEAARQSRFSASVYAYPENAVSRFFARHLGLVERYFNKKTKQMTGMITTIACSLCDEEAHTPPAEEKPAVEVS